MAVPLRRLARFILVLGFASELQATVSLPSVFGDGMVLQHGRPVPLWGKAAAGESIKVLIAGKLATSCSADADGNWRTSLPAMQPGAVGDIVIEGENSISLKDVLAGDVWLCSGQSNMQMPVAADENFDGVLNWEQEVKAANYPELRFFDGTKWNVCSPQTVGKAYAVAYFFGRDLHRELMTPVGLLDAAVGGSPVDAWVPPFVWTDDLKRRCVEAYRPEYAIRLEDREKALANWHEAVGKAAKKGSPLPRKPSAPGTPEEYPKRLSALHDRLIQPLVPYGLRGVLWYQGETNAWRIEPYRDLLKLLISGWRQEWSSPEMPFLIVQLANWGQSEKYTRAKGRWAQIRAIQAEVVHDTPCCSLVTTIDLGDTSNLHPPNKQEVGHRAALAALKNVYGRDILASGPTPASVEWSAGSVGVNFDNIGAGLTLDASQGGFELAGDDGIFYPATAEVEGATIKVKATRMTATPAQVRYAWNDDPVGLLRNSKNLPAAPFFRVRN